MNIINKLRKWTSEGIERNKIYELNNVNNQIKFAAKNGSYSCKFNISRFYENRDDIYFYIIESLRKQGFKVELEMYGCNMSHTRLNISWR